MRRLTVVFAGLLITGLLCSSESYANQTASEPDVHALASSPQWLTTKVYIEGEPDTDVKASYPGVVGISMWDPQRNRYEFFYTDTGRSKHADGGGGYFLVTGDKKTHILVPDVGPTRTIVRRLEKLDSSEFTYSREVPRDMVSTNPPVRIYVVHAPYTGPMKTVMSN
ncbi:MULTISPECIES: DUF4822 domain-containing protein [Pseudomonas]|jgi:hypothetical protein|uniref:DUF4822 domain-containing protein n=1 Tax=Pseudomonas marginalis TaxID=298 RepID=A0A9X9BRH4_PSEMA|nr:MULTISPECIES: DUF4822 domain-containing protein [Pseudomonas]MDT9632277.1 DUF4822 domain-containing protein [Pseudomonas sp. JV449]TKJ77624.1 DUF4822 domain-containing protein [Pseudomonas sp. CFBP13509]TWR58824.1 DUF4822 domain-containing protein [Pseudomonas marginalis]WGT26344.1 DUF4822 domain-containing protein [Pseudomonas marginalis]CRM83391.1 hypothetical protein [Pseudomonas sp. 8 R 14]